MMDCKEALVNADGDFDKAVDFLREKGLAKAAKRAGRDASDGIVEVYSHGGGRIGVMVEVNCETDFVAKSDSFKEFAHEVALQVAANSPLCVSEDQLPAEAIEREENVARNRAIEEGKPENILDKIVAGKLTFGMAIKPSRICSTRSLLPSVRISSSGGLPALSLANIPRKMRTKNNRQDRGQPVRLASFTIPDNRVRLFEKNRLYKENLNA